MSRNSFKFISLALAALLTVAPVSAIDWNSNSSRWGLGLAVIGLVCVVTYNYFWRNTSKQEEKNPERSKKITEERLQNMGGKSVLPTDIPGNPDNKN